MSEDQIVHVATATVTECLAASLRHDSMKASAISLLGYTFALEKFAS